ncbi:hypothetical protein [Saccharibacillus sacchari]|uniref:Uncharacterized protein n=1 Tax=Saccharibacillus sacchari TaxID=456493 RepID=A0ACC6PJN3_9BACL
MTILATQKLIKQMTADQRPDRIIIEAYMNVIVKHGDIEDAKALFELWTALPEDYTNELLLRGIGAHGDAGLAQRLYAYSIERGVLKTGLPDETLLTLGYMGVEAATEQLLQMVSINDWHVSANACLGLLHLSCASYEEEIREMLKASFGEALFKEFLPALAHKVADRSIVPELFEWGEKTASVDCNAGLILGIACFGAEEKETIRRILWSPNWEAHGKGTGTGYWSCIAMQHVGLTFAEMVEDVKKLGEQAGAERDLEYRLDVLETLMVHRLTHSYNPIRFMKNSEETTIEWYKALFDWQPEEPGKYGGITDLILKRLPEEDGLLGRYYELERKLEIAIMQDMGKE